MEVHVEIAPPVLFHLGAFPVTNTMIAAWLAMVVLVLFAVAATRRMAMVPGGLQNLAEFAVEGLLGICEQTAGPRRARRFLPIVATLFLFILTANWMGILPFYGEGELTLGGHSLLRSANSDISITLAMGLFVFVMFEFMGFRAAGLGYLMEFIWPGMLIEVISHLARPVALALRLFGNILAGEILLTVMSSLTKWVVVPALFMAFEMFVGIVQALIFALLTLAFFTLATEHEELHHKATESGEHGGGHH